MKENLPLWYHAKSAPATRKLYKTKAAKCLQKNHGIQLVSDTTSLLGRITENHIQRKNCSCKMCGELRTTTKCTNPTQCIEMTIALMNKIIPRWDLRLPDNVANNQENEQNRTQEQEGILVNTDNSTSKLKKAITIFGKPHLDHTMPTPPHPDTQNDASRMMDIYTDSACMNNSHANAQAGAGVWYRTNDPRNISTRVPLTTQSN